MGLIIVAMFAALALAAPLIVPYRVIELAGDPLEAPSRRHLLGTNGVGQDVASQLLSGARISLFVALVAGGGTLLIGTLVGMIAGWAGGTTDAALMRIVDLVLIIPKIPLLIVSGTYAGPGLTILSVSIARTSWPPTSRVIRSQILSLRRTDASGGISHHFQASVKKSRRAPARRHVPGNGPRAAHQPPANAASPRRRSKPAEWAVTGWRPPSRKPVAAEENPPGAPGSASQPPGAPGSASQPAIWELRPMTTTGWRGSV